MTELKCKSCSRGWPLDSEQAVCIENHGGCIVCHHLWLLPQEWDAIIAESRNRRAGEGEK